MIQQDDAVRYFGIVCGNGLESDLHSRDSCEHWPQQFGFRGINHHWQYLAPWQLEHGAIVLGKSILSEQARLEPSGNSCFEVERSVLLGARLQIETLGSDGRAAKLHTQWNGSRRIAVVFHGDEDIPRIRIAEGPAHTDLAQAAMFDGTRNGDEAEIGGQRERRIFIGGDAAGAHEHDFTRLLRAYSLGLFGEIERRADVEFRSSRLGLIDGLADLAAVGF